MRLLPLIALVAACPELTDDDDPVDLRVEPFPRCADVDTLRRPYFGDTHVHTTLSLDANLQGTRLDPSDAYRFARGERVELQPYDAEGNGLRALQLARPLDWVVVSDHAEFLGTVAACQDPESPAYDEQGCVLFRDNPDFAFITVNGALAFVPSVAAYPPLCGVDGTTCKEAGLDVWAEITEAAEAAYDRTDDCTFTSFVGYEWSGNPDARNLHRNVVFRNEHVPELPVGYFDAPTVEGLWASLRQDCLDEAPCDVLTIPHNSNLSTGLMFTSFDEEVTAEEAEGRREFEPLIEVYQHKGDSECGLGTPAADELCDFEKLPYNTLSGANLGIEGDPVPRDFVRDVIGEGLTYGAAGQLDPYLYGFIASTDTHLATPGASDEAGFAGHGGAGQNNRDALPPGLPDNATFSPGGLAVLWAEENSREALFGAMRRREAYGTSGPRMIVRTWSGRGLPTDLCDADFDGRGDAEGVPMGGVMEGGDGPMRIAVRALADDGTSTEEGVPLQRIQVVKGWVEAGETRFEVVDIAGGEDGSGVDVDTCARDEGSGGHGELCAVWEDPDFDPDAPAFWYVRVLEQPRCRWHTLQCNAAGITCPTEAEGFGACCDDDLPKTLQERAWTSPVWWRPDG